MGVEAASSGSDGRLHTLHDIWRGFGGVAGFMGVKF